MTIILLIPYSMKSYVSVREKSNNYELFVSSSCSWIRRTTWSDG